MAVLESVRGAVIAEPYSADRARADIRHVREIYGSTIESFAGLVQRQKHTWGTTHYEGVPVLKFPNDLWTYHEWLHTLKPSLLIETGTARGGSALYFARQMESWGGKVMTFDIERQEGRPHHPAIRYVTNDSTNASTVQWAVAQYPTSRVMVVLDSCHDTDHVLKELDIYAPLVSKGQMLVVEDTNQPGPRAALEQWLPKHPEFQPEILCERHLVTCAPGGWLRRVA